MIDDLLSEIKKIQNSTSLKSISLSENERLIFNKANNLLSRREYSKIELTRKLKQRLTDKADLIPGVIEKLEDAGYLSDHRYSEMIIKKLLKKGTAEQNIMSELKAHNIFVTREEITVIADELGLDKKDQIDTLINKKRRMIKSKPAQKQRESLIRYLCGKGYSYEEIKPHIERNLLESF